MKSCKYKYMSSCVLLAQNHFSSSFFPALPTQINKCAKNSWLATEGCEYDCYSRNKKLQAGWLGGWLLLV